MRVLYVSKAMIVPAYRDKLRALAGMVDLHAVVPARWGRHLTAPSHDEPWLSTAATFAHGHNHFHLYRDAGRIVHQDHVDLVHIDEEPYSAVTAQLARHCWRQGVPSLFFAWQNLPRWIPAPFRALRRYVFTHVAGGIAGTESAAGILRDWGFDGPIAVIPQMGVDPDRFRPDPEARTETRIRIGAQDTDFVVGFGGRLVREKGVHILLDVVAGMDRSRLLFLGDGPERADLARKAMRAGAADRVHFAGSVASSEMARWLPACDVLVLPSLTTRTWAEQFGRILVEAMACGVAVVGSDSGEIPRVIGEAGLVVREGDSASLLAALTRLADNPAQRCDLVTRGSQRVRNHFTNAGIAERTVNFYRQVVPAGMTS